MGALRPGRGPFSAARAALAGPALALALVATAATPGCQDGDKPFAEAYVIESLDQAIGGPTANARVGDVVLHNDRIRAVIEQGDVSFHPTDVGGTLIDLDLARPEREFRRGNGLDQLGQIAPIANLSVARATKPPHVRITGSAHGAEVTAATEAGPVLRILVALTILLNQEFVPETPRFRLYNEYELRPGEQFVRVTSTLGFDVEFCPPGDGDGCNPECDDIFYDDDCTCEVPARCLTGVRVEEGDLLPDRDVASILDIALGDLPRPLGSGSCLVDDECDTAAGETCVDVTAGDELSGIYRVCRGPDGRDAGVFLGDLLIFGGNLSPWLRGVGYDTETDIRRLFDQGGDTLAQPLELDGVFAIGDRVSYGYAAASLDDSALGEILVPIFGGPFSMGVTHAASCPTGDPGCKRGVLVRFQRWISVGTGDAASAQEPILRAVGRPLGTVAGVVTEMPSGRPASGVSVYALADPRALPCQGACESECPVPAGEPGSWTLEQLVDANRCRTKEPPVFPLGTASIETFARTDPGTDPIRDGRYQMALPPGSYVLVAIDGTRARSAPVPVTITEGQTSRAALVLPEPGRLAYTVFDGRGQPVAARVTIGHCLPTGACASDDDCGAGESCQSGSCACPWTTLLPIELGGARPQDGVVATDVTASGTGEVALPPGTYEVLFSHGPHYSADRRTVVIEPRVATRVDAFVTRQVDRQGWVTADFHVHATNSMDSGHPLSERVAGFLAEDMDFLSSSDHDWLTRYDVIIDEMGVSDRLSSQIGVEMTTQEYGHFLAFPLRYQAFADGERVTSNGAVQWRGDDPFTYLPPGGIIESARQTLDIDGPGTGVPLLIDTPHPYDYFDFYLLDPITLEPQPTLLALFNPMLDRSNFSGDFDVMELVNSKTFSRIRRATVDDIRFYSRALDDLIEQLDTGRIDAEEYSRAVYDLSIESIKQRLHRTPEEQEAILEGRGAGDVACYCGSDGDCAAGLLCDHSTMRCVEPPVSGDPPAEGSGLCARWRGVVDDWFNMLNRGVFRTGVSGSDVHGGGVGHMRTLVRTDGTTPPYLQAADVADALLHGRAIVTNGPMIHLAVTTPQGSAGIGDAVTATAGQEVTLSLRVEKADWYDVDRVEVYRNGVLIHWLRGCESQRGRDDPHGHPCVATGDRVLAWQGDLTDSPGGDAWYVVLVYGIDGRTMAPVYRSQVLASLGTPEITQRIYDIIPALREFRNPRFPSQHPIFPFAFTNPVWLDVGGDGWTPPEPQSPCWCVAGRDDDYPVPDGLPFPRRDLGCVGDGVCAD